MNKSERERALDLDAVRRVKRAKKRRKIIMITGVVALVVSVIALILFSQVGQVLDDGKGFWGNFNSEHHTASANSSQ